MIKKIIPLVAISLLITSCSPKIELEKLNLDKEIPKKISEIKHVKERDYIYGLNSYFTEELQFFSFGNISFTKYEIPNGYAYSKNDLFVHVNSYENNKYLGFTLQLVNEEGDRLLEYLKKNKDYEVRSTGLNKGFVLFWNDKKNNQWLFFKQYEAKSRLDVPYTETCLMLIKHGVRVENSSSPDVFTIYESFNMTHPFKRGISLDF